MQIKTVSLCFKQVQRLSNNGLFLVNDWGSFLNERQSCYENLLCDRSLKSLLAEHSSTIEQVNKSKAFTVFEIISSLYYRENFHSDLIAFFLDPVQNHGMGLLGIELLVNLG